MPVVSRSATFARLGAEFVVIVTGVLVALAVDQWRESRDDRFQELQLLESFVLDLQLDSADYAVMPTRSLGRVRGAEILLRNLAPQMPRSVRALETVDSAGPYPVPASDEELIEAFRQVEIDADLDVAQGAYAYFSAGGGLRLVRNAILQRQIHEYYYQVTVNRTFDPVVASALEELRRRAHDLGLGSAEDDAGRIREALRGPDAEPFFAALRTVQSQSAIQTRISRIMLGRALSLLEVLRAELDAA
jgi:hypothetical protein